MNPRDPVAEMLSAISRVLPRLPAGVEDNLRAALGGVFRQLDLVTREEFDVQREVLARARARLAELEQRLAELERQQPR
jgi:BMFP domain-containing protein YqiC